jgi:hypothetical protein
MTIVVIVLLIETNIAFVYLKVQVQALKVLLCPFLGMGVYSNEARKSFGSKQRPCIRILIIGMCYLFAKRATSTYDKKSEIRIHISA